MTRTSLKLSALALGLVFAACNQTQPPGTPTVAFTSVSDQQKLTAADGTASDGILTITITGQESGFTTQPLCELFVDGTEVQKNVAAATNGTVTFPGVELSGGTPATPHTLKIVCTDLSGQTATAGPITVSVGLGSTGSCSLTITPPDSTVFNETGAQVAGAVQDSDLTAAGIQTTLTVTMNQDGGACPDGLVSLTYDNGDGGLSSPTSVTSQNGVATFARITLPETTAAALGNVSKQLAVTASVDSSSLSVHYVVDSVDPSCTIVAPANGATITLADDIDSSTPGIQVTVSGSCTGLAGTTPTFNVVDTATGATYGTVVASGDAQGSFTGTGTLTNGTDKITLTGNSVTGNAITSTVSIVTVNTSCPMPTLSFKSPTENQSINLSFDELPTPGLQIPLSFTATAGNGATVQVCSTVAPATGATTCPFGSASTFLVTGTSQSAPVNNGSAILDGATLGDDGAAATQTLTAQVTDPCGSATATLDISVHALTPIIESITLLNAFTDSDGGLWLNASTVQSGQATTTVQVTVDETDDYDAGSASVTFNGSGAGGPSGFAGSSPPTADIIAGLADGTYAVLVKATDSWGNTSSTSQISPVSVNFPLFVKTTLPTCTITAPEVTNGCFNIADNGNAAANGAVTVPIVVTAQNASGAGLNGTTLNGIATVTNAGGPVSDPIGSVVSVSASSAQGANTYSATVTDPAGNPAAACTPATLNVNVNTVAPTLTVAPQAGGQGLDAQGFQIYDVRDGIPINVTTTDVANGATITLQIVGPTGGVSPKTPATVNANAASASLNGAPNGIDTVNATASDVCGNTGTGSASIDVQATGCDLSLVTPIPTQGATGESVVLNATQVDVNGNGAIELHTGCPLGTQVQFDSTATGGSDVPQTGAVDANGNVTFDLTGLVDGSTGTFTADIAGGETLPSISYDAKLSVPAFTGETPAAGNLEIVANQDNLILSDAGVTSLTVSGGSIVANEAQCTTTSCADFTLSGISGLGPADGNGNIGTATLALSFPGQNTTNPGPISVASGATSVTFSGVSLPAVATGTVTLTLTDNVGNVASQTWNVNADGIEPPAPVLTASMADKRTASVNLTWTSPASNGDSATTGYELAYLISNLQATPPTTPSEANYASWMLDPTIVGIAGTATSHTVTPLPTLNQYTFELRAIDAVGNRSPLAADATAASISGTDPNAWQTLVLTDSAAADANSDFGYVIRTGDFDKDGKQDLVITAPYQYAGPNTPGIVYILKGTTAANLATVTFANLTAITLGGTDWNYFGQDAWVADFNGDTFDDLAVGSPNANSGQGRVDIFFGGPGGLATTPSTTVLGDSTTAGQFGFSVNAADVNGDGIPDLIVGAPAMGASDNGASYVFLSSKTWSLPDAGVDVTSATSIITGKAGDSVGARWGTVDLGDINADGDQDFTVGAPGGGGTDGFDGGSGTEYGISGKTVLTNATIDLTSATPLFTLVGRVGGFCDPQGWGYAGGFWDCFGESAIAADFTGGTLPDLLVSSGYYNAIYLYSMTNTGPTTPPVFSDVEDANLGGNPGWTMAAPDLNGDGHADLLVGENNSASPNVFLYLNTGTGLAAPPSAELLGPANSYFGYAVGSGDLNGIGKQDFAVSDPVTQYVNVYY